MEGVEGISPTDCRARCRPNAGLHAKIDGVMGLSANMDCDSGDPSSIDGVQGVPQVEDLGVHETKWEDSNFLGVGVYISPCSMSRGNSAKETCLPIFLGRTTVMLLKSKVGGSELSQKIGVSECRSLSSVWACGKVGSPMYLFDVLCISELSDECPLLMLSKSGGFFKVSKTFVLRAASGGQPSSIVSGISTWESSIASDSESLHSKIDPPKSVGLGCLAIMRGESASQQTGKLFPIL